MAYTTVNDSSANFQTALYTGSTSSVTVTNDGNSNLQPDLIWVKRRNGANDHNIFDTNRGLDNRQWTNLASASTTGTSVSALTDGFSTGTYWGDINSNGNTFVGWQWKGNGGTNSSNYDGSITSTVQANTTAGFSIVKWTGTGSNGTVGHGLGVAPNVILFKNYPNAENWTTYHSVLGNTGGLYLNLTNAFNTAGTWYQDTSPTSSVFSVGTNSKTNGGTMMAYCFANIQGYSSFGKYTGNGNADGPFIYTGFAPAWVVLKNSNVGTDDWHMFDTKRDPINRASQRLNPNLNNAEASDGALDFLSNGFKIRSTSNARNGSGNTIIYMAFAREPLVGTNNIAVTAK